MTLLDLSATFDIVNHQILLTKLQLSFGISSSCMSSFTSYLSNRTQAVTVTILQSHHTPFCYGVTQGSVLGPVLFILYMAHTLFDYASRHTVSHHAFADDNQLCYISIPDAVHQSIDTLQDCTTDVKS